MKKIVLLAFLFFQLAAWAQPPMSSDLCRRQLKAELSGIPDATIQKKEIPISQGAAKAREITPQTTSNSSQTEKVVLKPAPAASSVPPSSQQRATKNNSDNSFLTSLSANYITRDFGYPSGEFVRGYVLQIQEATESSITLKNLLGAGQTVTGTVDEAKREISIMPQVVYRDDTYGDFYCCPVNFGQGRYYPDQPVIIHVNADGSLQIDGWGIFVLTGEHAGTQILCSATDAVKANATLKDVSKMFDTEKEYPAYVQKINSREVLIRNFCNLGTECVLAVDTLGNVEVPRQIIYTVTSGASIRNYYNYNVTSFTSTTSFKLNTDPIKGKFEGMKISLGTWALAYSTSVSSTVDVIDSTFVAMPYAFEPYSCALLLEGAGTAENPYRIKSAADLENLSQAINNTNAYTASSKSFEGKYFIQTADIDMSSIPAFIPIANVKAKAFCGSYDGGHHTISNLYVDKRNTTMGGLFGSLGAGSTVRNLIFKNPTIKGATPLGGVVAGESYASIDSITVTGGMISNCGTYVGGIVGGNYGTISDCSYSGTVGGDTYVGGIVGNNYHQIIRCSSNASICVNSKAGIAGGITGGSQRATGKVSDSYFYGTFVESAGSMVAGGVAGSVSLATITRCWAGSKIVSSGSDSYLGSLIGKTDTGIVEDCYAFGLINGQNTVYAGGLIGGITGKATLKNCYTTSFVLTASTNEVREIVGNATVDYNRTNTFFDSQVAYLTTDSVSLSTKELTAAAGVAGFDPEVWYFTEGLYPRLKGSDQHPMALLGASSFRMDPADRVGKVKKGIRLYTPEGVEWKLMHNMQFGPQGNGMHIEGDSLLFTASDICSDTLVAFAGDEFKFYALRIVPDLFSGTGTSTDPYLITTKDDLLRLAQTSNDASYGYDGIYLKLTNDIDMQQDTRFKGIAIKSVQIPFNGHFDGCGFKIHNLLINTLTYDESGAIAGGDNTAISLFGSIGMKASVRNLILDGDCAITGGLFIAGFTCINQGVISGCQNFAAITAISGSAAGIAGYNDGGVIEECYNGGTILSGGANAGGIVAQNSGDLKRCQNDGIVSARILSALQTDSTQLMRIGGIVGYNGGVITDCLNSGMIDGCKLIGGIYGSGTTGATSLTRCINTGIISADAKGSLGAIGGEKPSSTVFTGCFHDAQLGLYASVGGNSMAEIPGKTTAEMIVGMAPDGYESDAWLFEAGCYPRLRMTDTIASAKAASSIYLQLGDPSQMRNTLKTGFTLQAPSQTVWHLAQGSNLHIDGLSVQVTVPQGAAVTDTLTAKHDGYERTFILQMNPPALGRGNGSEEQPWLIASATDFNRFANYANTNEYTFVNEYVRVEQDLDFEQEPFVSVANNGTLKFLGHFDGNGKKMSHVSIESDQNNQGVFGMVGVEGVVRRLTLDNTCTVTAAQYAGGIVGRLSGQIDSCVNYAAVKTTKNSYAAGITSYAETTAAVRNCVNYGNITSFTQNAAGIAGYADEKTVISDCINKGTIAGTNSIAGIVSSCKSSVIKCRNTGAIQATGNYAGGIVGYQWGTDPLYSDCHNSGDIAGTYYLGGIVGYSMNPATIEMSTNTGLILGSSYGVGGILGHENKAGGLLRNVENSGDVFSDKYNVGGIVGSHKGTIVSAVNTGSVIATTYSAGGICGYSTGSLDSCYNAAPVEGTYQLGGIVGSSGTSSVTSLSNCVNLGDVTSIGTTAATSKCIGGILGTGKNKLQNVYNMGVVTGFSSTAGLVGLPVKGTASVPGTTLKRGYSANRVEITDEQNTTTCGNIVGTGGLAFVTADSVYYETTLGYAVFGTDTVGSAATATEMAAIDFGKGWVRRDFCFPVLGFVADSALVKLHSAAVCLAEGETASAVKSTFKIGVPEGVVWSGSDAFILEGNNVKLVENKAGTVGTLLATAGNNKRTYSLTLGNVTGISAIESVGAVVSRQEYVSTNGIRSAYPHPGLNIIITYYENGTRKITRTYFPE